MNLYPDKDASKTVIKEGKWLLMNDTNEIKEVAAKIGALYDGLRNGGHESLEMIARDINTILLHDDVPLDILRKAWDEWYAQHKEQQNA